MFCFQKVITLSQNNRFLPVSAITLWRFSPLNDAAGFYDCTFFTFLNFKTAESSSVKFLHAVLGGSIVDENLKIQQHWENRSKSSDCLVSVEMEAAALQSSDSVNLNIKRYIERSGSWKVSKIRIRHVSKTNN